MFINRKNILRHFRDLAIMAVIGLSLTYLLTPDFIFWGTVVYSTLIGFILWKGNEYIPYKLDKIMPWRKYLLKRLIVNTLLSFFYTLLATLIVSYLWFGVIWQNNFEALLILAISQIVIASVSIFLMLLFVYTILFFNNWKASIQNEEKLKREVLALQFETLKNQVNPHFLFNCLNILTPLVYKNPDEAAKFIKQFSEVYRYVLQQKDNEIVSLSTEMEFVNSYIYLNKIRFGDNLQVKIEIENYSQMVVPLSLQMLIENAIKHNIISKDEPLYISIFTDKNNYLTVKNNLQKKEVLNNSVQIGLANIKSRYEFLTEKGFIIEENDKEFIVKIPLMSDEL